MLWFPCICHCCRRIDPKSACRIEITVNSYFTMRDGRKEYNRGRTISCVVDSEEYSIIDLEKDVASEFNGPATNKQISGFLQGSCDQQIGFRCAAS